METIPNSCTNDKPAGRRSRRVSSPAPLPLIDAKLINEMHTINLHTQTKGPSRKRQWKRTALFSAAALAAFGTALMCRRSHDTTIAAPEVPFLKRPRSRSLGNKRKEKKKQKQSADNSDISSNSNQSTSPNNNSCLTVSWHVHPDPSHYDTCTNSPIYPSHWDGPDMVHFMFHSSSVDCCEAIKDMFGEAVVCKMVDVCDGSSSDAGDGWTMTSSTTTTSTTTSTTTTTTTSTTVKTEPASLPTTTTASSSTNNKIFYPLPTSNLCLSDSHHQNISPQFHYSTPEQCCSSGYIDYNLCLSNTYTLLYSVAETNEPSSSPNTENPTWSPTMYDCTAVNDLWHMSTTKLFSCTNDNVYPQEWMEEPSIHFFTSPNECCLGKFPGLACNVVDVCVPTSSPTRAPTKVPTSPPTNAPTRDPSSTQSPTGQPVSYTRGECSNNKWHKSRVYDGVCSNDDDYPNTWNHETLVMYFLSEDVEGCCEMNHFGRPGKECIIFDICHTGAPTPNPTVPPPTKHPSSTSQPTNHPTPHPTPHQTQMPISIDTSKPTSKPTHQPTPRPTKKPTKPKQECGTQWHPDTSTTSEKRCTNGLKDYPPVWDRLNADAKAKVFFSTAEKCCQEYWSMDCVIEDYCLEDVDEIDNTGSGNENGNGDCNVHEFWHPVTNPGPKACSNGLDDFPAAWNNLPSMQQTNVFFANANDCCQKYWKGDCVQTDYCAGDPEPHDESQNEDNGSDTDNGSGEEEPSVENPNNDCDVHEYWHPVTNPGPDSCSNGKDGIDYPKSWDSLPTQQRATIFFDSAEACCQGYWKGPCVHTDYCGEPDDETVDGEDTPVDGGEPDNGPDDEEDDESSTGTERDCRLWHPVVDSHPKTCSNKQDYPEAWDNLPPLEKGAVLFGTAADCCITYWEGPCEHDYHPCNLESPDGGNDTNPPTDAPTPKPMTVNNGGVVTSLGMDTFDDPSSSFPWNTGNPPEWSITNLESGTGSSTMVVTPVSSDDPARKKSTLSLKTNLSTSTRFRCNVKVDTMMPFDWFSLKVNGSIKYPYYSSSNGQWTSFGTSLAPGENLIELVVEAGPSKPAFGRNTGLGYGSGYVWLDDCELKA